ncbi:dipeptide/oligopeptide/nickel ABC transporter permease/ATP-binding protein [Mariluticola halotolerans]|uniref:dipeptide/oligopeptide/nickel ABC transporter permease/ATP-binding protein n=1 Tax=Mariluticola halotolerans TaxID=2909283 RepID=UPI0026E1EB0B|nr:dipeptide/oligopeptide/nickel ABC transporter permease/ATP-binding protein [Mariluticola halotolerans]UJQ93076.1 dipeptide/oligopeptide/nickel ABC transporter permease/ATP-binding protein [Mariluticola halotolerans]
MSAPQATATAPKASRRPNAWQLLMNNTLAAIGFYVIALIALAAVLVPILPLPDPDLTNLANRLQPVMTDGHLLGTDHLGRDIFARLIWGTRVSLLVGISASLVAAFFGSAIGLIAGYAGGRTDNIMMRGIDMLMAFPYILLALAIVAVLGPGLMNALYAIAVVNIPFFARNIRGITVGLAHKEFVDAARLSGKGHIAIVLTEILPNVMPIIVITMSTTVGWMILETAGLSFLGLGAQPPQADLGSMLGEGRSLLFNAPVVSLIPGIMVFFIVMSINLLGDGVRDALDPRLRAGALSRPMPVTRIDRNHAPDTSARGKQAALSVENLETSFESSNGLVPAVKGISFSVQKGECLGLIGESGSGKSVTALSLLGLVASPPGVITGGAVAVEGRDMFALSATEISTYRGGKVSYVFQDPLTTLHPLFSIGDQVAEAVRAHQPVSRTEAYKKAIALLETVRIPDAAERASAYPHQLSGGQRQRVGIAMALANDPDIIIADEPTTALDVTVQAEILRLLQALRTERGLALLFITHDFGVVAEVCDRVAVMRHGEIVETGDTKTVLGNPQHPYTKRLIACVPKPGQGRKFLDDLRKLPALDPVEAEA